MKLSCGHEEMHRVAEGQTGWLEQHGVCGAMPWQADAEWSSWRLIASQACRSFRTRLRIQIDHQNSALLLAQSGRQVHSGGVFSAAAFLIDNRYRSQYVA
jgi:hypothetical protein